MFAHDHSGTKSPVRSVHNIQWVALIGLIILAACDAEPPTATPIPTIKGALQPSATVNPAAQQVTSLPGGNVDALDFTPGAAPTTANGDPVTITPSPVPTQPSIPLHVPATDLTLFGSYYPAPHSPAPALLLLHGIGDTKEQWGALPSQLQAAGFAVMAIDLRGYGETGSEPNWKDAPADAAAALTYLRGVRGVDPARVSVIGAGIGANLAITACAADKACKGAIAISPRVVDQGISAHEAIQPLGKRPLLILVGADEPNAPDSTVLANAALGDHRVERYAGKLNGLALLNAHPEATTLIIDWLDAHP